MTIPDAALGAIVAATITGVLSLLGLVIAKEQKVSEFRQAWIDALRADLATMLGHANVMALNWHSEDEKPSQGWPRLREHYLGATQHTASIRLRLNPKESEAILNLISQLESHFEPESKPNMKTLVELEKKLLAEAQILLKNEWVRVRDGERVYRTTRATALAVVVIGLLTIGAHLASGWFGR